jgi:hypothetical protein
VQENGSGLIVVVRPDPGNAGLQPHLDCPSGAPEIRITIHRSQYSCARIPKYSGEHGLLRPIHSDVAAAGQPSGPAPAAVRSRPACRNNNADPTNNATKSPLTPRISTGLLCSEPNPKNSAITATDA